MGPLQLGALQQTVGVLSTRQVCAAHLRARYGAQLRLGLLGYSLGNTAVRHLRVDWPKAHIAGPSPTGKIAPLAPFFMTDASAQPAEASTAAPCVVIASHADPFAPPPEAAARLAGT